MRAARSSRRDLSIFTPTMMARRPGIRKWRHRAGTGWTTVVMGNCGVGFAPAKPDRHEMADQPDGGGGGYPRHRGWPKE